ncbi:eukaryotic aspartyl protease [Hirsutella rhossiliensis]|uniref:Eukaryotic aspartyl protease domain-containing protein n=1 Tax=Hirsutella rhossiliensis TaxID=111463 RepID=A0A9P8N3E5_9HYPO|nr:eukaryotic aspartyl protease domain-containing protein [Hirsutella rhossiliensis]KAH0965246.1 eukaryotic aspartyl protease domain-containing protein [Hirsutella rhossiliensis]
MAPLWPLAVLPLVVHALSGIPADNQMVEMPGMIRYPITVVDGAPAKDRVFRRQNDVGLAPRKLGFFYSIEVKLGTPSQAVSVNFDTGSDELWVNPTCSKSADPAFCQNFGRFNGSQTFVDVKRNSTINYGTGFANLEYGYDYVQIGSSKLSQQLLGVATASEFAVTGILGAGPNLDGWNSHYPTVIDNLATQGFTNSRAFSLDIRSIESKRGSVVFGGLDTKKFSGPLEKRPIVPAAQSPDGLTRYWVYLDGISITQPNGSVVNAFDKPNGQAVLLDSGYTVSALPSAIFDKILAAFPEAKPPAQGTNLYEVPCSIGNSKGRVDFKFGKTVIKVPYNDFIWHQSANGVCVLGVTRDDDFPVLGDTFLRAAYVVYDWDNRNLHVANNEDCGSHLVAIGKGPDSVPSVVGECGAQYTTTPSSARPTSAPISNLTSTKGRGGITSTVSSRPADITSRPIASSSTSSCDSSDPSTFTYSSDLPPNPSDLPNDSSDPSTYSELPSDSDPDLSTSSSALPNYSGPSTYSSDLLTYTSTFTSTRTYAVTSCPPSVTDCPADSVTTETITGTTTWCPSQSATAALSTTIITSVIVTTKTYTVTDCHGQDCGKGYATTEVLTSTKQPWTDITATWTIPRTHTCTKGEHGCVPGQKITTTDIVTVKPMTTGPSPTPVPGCTDCRMPPPVVNPPEQASFPAPLTPLEISPQSRPVETYPAQVPPNQAVNNVPGTISMVTKPTASCVSCGPGGYSPPMVTAGATAWRAPMAAVVVGAIFAAAI